MNRHVLQLKEASGRRQHKHTHRFTACIRNALCAPSMQRRYPFLRLDRPLHVLFWQRLMSAGVRTLDGDKADYYFIPVNTRGALANDQMKWALEHIRTTYPWWAKDNGHRHLVIHTGDMGYVFFGFRIDVSVCMHILGPCGYVCTCSLVSIAQAVIAPNAKATDKVALHVIVPCHLHP